MKRLRWLGVLAMGLLVWQVTRTGKLEGELLGMPYDLRPPTRARFQQRCWNPDEPRLFTPHVFGWGYSVNGYEMGRRLGLIAGR